MTRALLQTEIKTATRLRLAQHWQVTEVSQEWNLLLPTVCLLSPLYSFRTKQMKDSHEGTYQNVNMNDVLRRNDEDANSATETNGSAENRRTASHEARG